MGDGAGASLGLIEQGKEFSCSIDEIARYYHPYLDPEGSVRRILDHCGRTFESGVPAWLDPRETALGDVMVRYRDA